jgi:uncharacterized protein (TIGR02145 family)
MGIEGATVKLENAGITTTTLSDGSFTLSGIQANIDHKKTGQLSNSTNVSIRNSKLHFFLKESSVIEFDIFNIEGGLLYSLRKTFAEGLHFLPLPNNNIGINIYRLKIGSIDHIFKVIVSGKTLIKSSIGNEISQFSSNLAKPTVTINDIIVVSKAGYLSRRIIVNNSDTSDIEIIMVTILITGNTVTDIDGNVYNTIIIGNQEWSVENLRTTKFNDGTPIQHVTSSTEWEDLNTPGRCFWANDSVTYAEKYGALYNWFTIYNQFAEEKQKLAPIGWHISTDDDWNQLVEYLKTNGYNWDGTTSGYKIAKALATQTDWLSTQTSEEGSIGNDLSKNNTSGFSALPGGFRNRNGNFGNLGSQGYWWSATEERATNAWNRRLVCCSTSANYPYGYPYDKGWGFSVRLVRD